MPLRDFTQAEITVTERRRFEAPLLAMVWLGVAAFGAVEGVWFHPMAGSLAVLVNLAALRRGGEVYLHRWLVNLSVLVATGILVAELLVNEAEVLTALTNYLILIQLCKLFERKTNRDYVQIMALSVLVVVSAAMKTAEMWFAWLLLGYLVLACYAAMAFTLKRGLDAVAEARLATETDPMAPHRVAWNVGRDWPARPLLAQVARLLPLLLALGAMLFLVLPRPDSQAFADWQAHSEQDSASVRLGRARKIRLSGRVVLEVTPDGKSWDGYLRGPVFYDYDRSHWTSRDGEQPRGQVIPPRDVLDSARELSFRISPSLLPTLYVPTGLLHVEADEAGVVVRNEVYRLAVDDADDWRTYRTRIVSWPVDQDQQAVLSGDAHRTAPANLTSEAGIYVDPRVRELARGICADLLTRRRVEDDPGETLNRQIAHRLAIHLRTNYAYSLDLTDADSRRDGVADFLFHMKQGHCEYYASALTVMCRALGVPARLATGYRAPAAELSYDRRIFVREKHAHAWTEVLDPRRGWIVYDATPAATEEEAPTGGWFDWLYHVRLFWEERVLAYAAEDRQRLAMALRDAITAIRQAATDAVAASREGIVQLLASGQVDRAMIRLLVAISILGLIVEGLIVYRFLRRHRRLATRAGDVPLRQFTFADAFLRALGRRAGEPRPGQTLREWALAAAAQCHLPAQRVARLLDLYDQLRWGRMPVRGARFDQARADARAFVLALRKGPNMARADTT